MKRLLFIAFLLLLSCNPKKPNIAISEDKVPIHFNLYGSGNISVVFVHGWGGNKDHWNYQIPYFSPHYKVVTIDLAGHGNSGLNRENWSVEAFGKDIYSVIELLNLNNIVLVGHSMGAPVIVETELLVSNKVIGLVAIDVFHNIESKISQSSWDKRYASLRDDWKNSWIQWTKFSFDTSSSIDLINRRITDQDNFSKEVALNSLKGVYSWQNTKSPQIFTRIKCPIRCIVSDKGQSRPEIGQKYAKSFEMITIKNVGHFIHWENPEEFNSQLDTLIKEFQELNNID